ncbi:MAG: aminoacyl-tRNA hydrolase [Candidatus Tectomicrobia bacterium]|uniref:Peptidyl-tRNA hydrolase n=1 Tax=Tectimicrobiota bacterium TaxID=2528274 RepID=A0A932GN85_UNCTE|nr:aminoacyl-tRNA hydrolase [Candidatus Tectomicrobia bacterium]
MKLIVGLGNPGRRYELTRHNIGMMVVRELARRHRVTLTEKRCHCFLGKGKVDGLDVILALPQEFMNRSGQPVRDLLKEFSLSLEDLVVVHDDIDLALGKIRKKLRGGDAGHRGIRSIIEEVGSAEFVRLRVGIGRPAEGQDPAEYVLEPFSPGELDLASEMISRAVQRLEEIAVGTPGR